MAVNQEFQITLTAKDGTSTVFKAIGDGAQKTAKGFESFEGKIVAVSAALEVAKEAFEVVKGAVDMLTEAYRVHERASETFIKSMEYSRNYSVKTANSLMAYAVELQKVTGIEKTTTLGLMAKAQAMGLSEKLTKEAITATANYAAATNTEVNAASFDKVLGTLHGSVDAWKDMVPAMRHANAEALAAGAGFKLINEQFKDAAKSAGDEWETFSKRSSASKSDILASIGEILEKSLGLKEMARDSAEFWERAAAGIEKYKDKAISVITPIANAMKTAMSQVAHGGFLPKEIPKLAISKAARLDASPIETGSNKGSGSRVTIEDPRLKEQFELASRQLRAFMLSGKQAQMELAKVGQGEADGINAEFRALVAGAEKNLEAVGKYQQITSVQRKAFNEAIIAAEQLKTAKIIEINKQAALAGASATHAILDNELEAEKTALANKYRNLDDLAKNDLDHYQQYQQAKLKAAQDSQQKINEMIAWYMGDSTAIVKMNYDKQIRAYDDMLAKKEITKEMYDTAKAKAGDKATTDTGGAIAANMAVSNVVPVLGQANMIADAVKALLDFFPQFIQKIADIINMISDLPQKLVTAINNLLSSVISFFKDFPDKLQKALTQLLDGVDKFIDKLPDAMMASVQKLPEVFIKIVARLPDIIAKLFILLEIELPKMAIVMAVELIKSAPRMALAFVKALYVELPKAMFLALRQALAQLGGMISDLFKGGFKMPKLAIDTTALVRAFDSLKGSASDIFKVEDLANAAKSVTLAKDIRDAAESAALNIGRLLMQLWRDLEALVKKAWQWVYDHVIAPIITIVQRAWQWVYDNIIAPIATVVRAAFQWVMDNIVTPLSNVGKAAFQWVQDNIVAPLQHVAAIFEGFKIPEFHWPEIPYPNWTITIPKPNWSITIDKPGWWPSSMGGLIPNGGQIGKAGQAVQDAWNGAQSAASSAAGSVGSAANSAGDAIAGAVGWERGGSVHGRGILYAESGTLVQGTDTVPSMLTAGEYVINRHAVSRVGLPALDRINSGNAPGNTNVVAPNITINTTAPIDQAFIRNQLVPTMMDAIKRASQNGRYVIAKAGIR